VSKKLKDCYKPKTILQKLGYLVEECGETMAAVGKTIRWGSTSTNPELPINKQELNRDWLIRELVDLKRAIKIVEEALDEEDYFI
jgi:NTP pyrophosphatase (non-canonical NTP hydrolase)